MIWTDMLFIDKTLFIKGISCTAALARQSNTIGAFVAGFAVPFPPISTRFAYLAMPGVTVLNNLVPTERIPIRYTAFPADVEIEELFERNALVPT
jgi:hypothetical protein